MHRLIEAEARRIAMRAQLFDARRPTDLVEVIERLTLFLYPGDRDLFADNSLSDFDREVAALLRKRALAFVEAVG